MLTGEVACAKCGHVFAAKEDENVPATELSSRLLGHICSNVLQERVSTSSVMQCIDNASRRSLWRPAYSHPGWPPSGASPMAR